MDVDTPILSNLHIKHCFQVIRHGNENNGNLCFIYIKWTYSFSWNCWWSQWKHRCNMVKEVQQNSLLNKMSDAVWKSLRDLIKADGQCHNATLLIYSECITPSIPCLPLFFISTPYDTCLALESFVCAWSEVWVRGTSFFINSRLCLGKIIFVCTPHYYICPVVFQLHVYEFGYIRMGTWSCTMWTADSDYWLSVPSQLIPCLSVWSEGLLCCSTLSFILSFG